jgi:transcriptional regulator with XRE-family HTH domain
MSYSHKDFGHQARLEFGSYLRELRKTQNLTLGKVAKDIGITNSYLSMIETGERGVTDRILVRLASQYRVPLQQMQIKRYLPQLPLLAGIVEPTEDLSNLLKGLRPEEVEEVKDYILFLRLKKAALG